MSSEKRFPLSTPTRRELMVGAAALSATAMLSPMALAQQFPTAKVNTTGLAVTDTEVTVGILHSVTGTMAISETGSVQAEKLAIEQINAQGGVLGRKTKFIQDAHRFRGEGRPVARAVLLGELDLAAEHAALRIDLLDGELLGLHRTGLGDRHGAGDGVQNADRHLGV